MPSSDSTTPSPPSEPAPATDALAHGPGAVTGVDVEIGPLRAGRFELHSVTWRLSSASTGSDSGPPIVLVHGLGGSTIGWEPVGATLAATTGRRVVAFDLPGFGRSPVPRPVAPVRTHVDAVAAVLESLGPAVVVGNSMGGLVGVLAALRDPRSVDGLVLVAPALPSASFSVRSALGAARFAPAALPLLGTAVVGARARLLGPERVTAARLATITRDPGRVDPGIRDRMVELARERMRRRECHRAYAVAARSLLAAAPVAWRRLRSVACPALVVHGRHDALVPVGLVNRLRRLHPSWDYAIFDDCGHVPHLEHPEAFTEVVGEWVTRP